MTTKNDFPDPVIVFIRDFYEVNPTERRVASIYPYASEPDLDLTLETYSGMKFLYSTKANYVFAFFFKNNFLAQNLNISLYANYIYLTLCRHDDKPLASQELKDKFLLKTITCDDDCGKKSYFKFIVDISSKCYSESVSDDYYLTDFIHLHYSPVKFSPDCIKTIVFISCLNTV